MIQSIGLRLVWRRGKRELPGLVAVVVAIAMAVAVNAALFAVLDGLQFRDLPFQHSDELVAVDFRPASDRPPPLAYLPELAAERDALRVRLETSGLIVQASQVGSYSFFGPDAAEAGIEVTGVDARFFDLLGLSPLIGRTFGPADENSAALLSRESAVPLPVLIGHGLWQRQFGGASNVLEGAHDLGGRRVRVVGVMPPGVKFPHETNVWAPVRPVGRPPSIVRLASGATIDALDGAFPELVFTPLRETVRPGDSRSVILLFCAAALLVLVAWVQIAALVSTGIVGRLHELGIHLALGATRARFMCQLWIEAGIVLTTALVLAGLATGPITEFVIGTLPNSLKDGQYLMPDLRTFGFAVAISLVGLVVLGWVPMPLILGASPGALLAGRLGDTPLRATRVRRTFLIAQIGLTTCLLYLAGLTIHSEVRASTFDYGFDADHVLVFWPPPRVPDSPVTRDLDRAGYRQRVLETVDRLNASPAVVAAAEVHAIRLSRLPAPGDWRIQAFAGREPYPELIALMSGAGPGFIDALGGTLLAGTRFDDPRHAGRTDIAIVNQTLANRLATPMTVMGVEVRGPVIGVQIRTAYFTGEIVGIVKDLVDSSPALSAQPQMFVPSIHPNWPGRRITINARAPLDTSLPAIRTALEEIWGPIPANRLGLARDELERILAPFRARSTLIGLIAALCLPLACVGLAGAIQYSVRSREREIAVRVAIGAAPALVRRSVIRSALGVVAIGLICGVALGALMSRVFAHQLFGVQSIDLATVIVVASALLGVGWLAALLPARAAARIESARLLRGI